MSKLISFILTGYFNWNMQLNFELVPNGTTLKGKQTTLTNLISEADARGVEIRALLSNTMASI